MTQINSNIQFPTNPSDRNIQIDILRGFALFGVLLVNVFGYNSSFFDFSGFYGSFTDDINSTIYEFVINYGADKFIFIFSFLFGSGFAIMYSKYKFNEKYFLRLYTRRLLVLMMFGIIHIVFFWAGDILFSYSVIGFILLISRKFSSKTLLLLSFIVYFFPILYLSLENIFTFLPDALSSVTNIKMPEVIKIYSKGSYGEILKLRWYEYTAFRNINLIYYAPKVMSLFLLGYVSYKNNFLKRINSSKIQFFILGIILISIGITLNLFTKDLVVFLASSWDNPYSTATYMGIYELANIFLGVSYILIIVVLSETPFLKTLLNPLKYIGRTALSNYLLQTIIFTTIMYSYGFGLFASFKPWELILSALFLFSIQIIASFIWLQYFKFGPAEWIWRKLTYLNINLQNKR